MNNSILLTQQEHQNREMRPRHLSQRWQNYVGLVLVIVYVLVAISAGWLTQHDDIYWTDEIRWPGDKYERAPHGPSSLTPLGTIPVPFPHRQMDVYTALVLGTPSALLFGLTAASSSALIGILLGATAAVTGGFFRAILMRITDAMLAIPVIVGVFLIDQLSEVAAGNVFTIFWMEQNYTPPSLFQDADPVLLGVILLSWMPYARIIHDMVLRINKAEFVTAARALGSSQLRMIFRHILPNAISPAIVLYARDIGGMVLIQTTLIYIGMGGEAPWAEMLVASRDWIIGPGGDILRRWWMFFPATLALVLFGLSWNLLGDGLNQWLNPREKNSISGSLR